MRNIATLIVVAVAVVGIGVGVWIGRGVAQGQTTWSGPQYEYLVVSPGKVGFFEVRDGIVKVPARASTQELLRQLPLLERWADMPGREDPGSPALDIPSKLPRDAFGVRESCIIQAILDDPGKEGWWLAHVVGTIGGDQEFIFMRQIK